MKSLSKPWRVFFISVSALFTMCFFGSAFADVKNDDANGGTDHPLIQRYQGSWLIGYHKVDWDQTQFPTSMNVKDGKWESPITVEGKLTRLFYLAPVGKSPLEVFRNYEQALKSAGFVMKFSCEQNCADIYFALDKTVDYSKGATWSKGSLETSDGSTYSIDHGAMSPDDGRFLYGTIPYNGKDVHILIYTSVAENNTTDRAATFIQIIEPKSMALGQVKVDTNAMEKGIENNGKVTLYGLYFDTASAAVKPESEPQLSEMAKLLNDQPTLKVYIVGHTDNAGTLEGNLLLSQQRAQAVIHSLVTDFKINANRLIGKGVANLSPVASNRSEEGACA